ncbi:hypothetical protein IKE19_02930 [Candidatus Saccharibacteria bacterium]|nr:hypothetical protein [Candidatus Saccharibacteria bacterium]
MIEHTKEESDFKEKSETEKPMKLPKEAYEQALRQKALKKYHLPATYVLWSQEDCDDDHFFGLTTDDLWEYF